MMRKAEHEMKEKKMTSKGKKKIFFASHQLRYIIATTIVLLSLFGFSTAFILRVYFMTESACYEQLAVETENAIVGLETNLRSDRTMLRVIAGLIGNANDIESLEVSGYLSNYDVNSLITQIGILLPENELLFAKGHQNNSDETLNFDLESIGDCKMQSQDSKRK